MNKYFNLNFLKKNLFKNYYNIKNSNHFLKNINLLYIFLNSYKNFLNFNLKNLLNNIFPIYSYKNNLCIDFVEYKILYPKKSKYYSLSKGLSYQISLNLKFNIFRFNFTNNFKFIKNKIKTENIIIPGIPFITPEATFIINGVEKVIVSKFKRSPGIYFIKELKGRNTNYVLKLVPDKGYEIDFFINYKNNIYLRYNKKTILIVDILKGSGLNSLEILNYFYNFIEVYFFDNNIIKLKFEECLFLNYSIPYDILNLNNEIILKKNKVINHEDIEKIKLNNIEFIHIDENFLINKLLGVNLYHKNLKFGSVLQKIDKEIIKNIFNFEIKKIKIIIWGTLSHYSIISSLITSEKNFFFSLNNLNNFLKFCGVKLFDFNILNFNFNYIKNIFQIDNICRKKLNFYFKKNFNFRYLNIKDIINIIKILISFKDGLLNESDMLEINNLNLYMVGEILNEMFFDFFLNFKKNVQKNFFDFENYKLSKFFKIYDLLLKIKNFFSTSKYCQYLDELNILSEISHKRKVTFLGVVGISKKYSGFNSRDLSSGHYSRLCPVETPEGINIGLVNSLALLCKVDKNNFLIAPYYKFVNGKIFNKWVYLSVDEEFNSFISEPKINFENFNDIDSVLSKYGDQLININPKLINYINILPYQMLSLSAVLIPFLENNDSNRALMASNMMKQALPLIFPSKPIISSGLEHLIGFNSGSLIKVLDKSFLIYSDSRITLLKKYLNYNDFYYYEYDVYFLLKYISSNQKTNKSNRINNIYRKMFNKGDILADSTSTMDGEISLGQNLFVAFMPWEGYNFEDSIIVSEKLLIEEKYTSLELIQIDVDVFKFSKQCDILSKNVFNSHVNLNKFGIIKNGSTVSGGDLVVGKLTPIFSEEEVNPNHRLLYSIFLSKNKDFNYNDSSFYLPEKFSYGVVISSDVYFSENSVLNSNDKLLLNFQISKFIDSKNFNFLFLKKKIKNMIKNYLIGKKIYFKNNFIYIDNNFLKNKSFNFFLNLKLFDYNNYKKFEKIKNKLKFFLKISKFFKKNLKNKFFKNLSANLSKTIKIIIILKKNLKIGDKMSGRYGNKGVISKILKLSEMPYLFNGKIVDVILNPLGVPSRMNVGQLLEVHLGFASICFSWKIFNYLSQNNFFLKIKNLLYKIYNYNNDLKNFFEKLNYSELLNLTSFFKNGIYFSISPFSGFNENYINYLLNLIFSDGFLHDFGISKNKKQLYLYDGYSGKRFENHTTVGIMYIFKLNHLSEDKIHSRSVGPYSMITQQPLKGKSNKGGQRLGEMEAWAIEAYGAFYSLQEMFTIKSDDVVGRFKNYKNIVKGINDFNLSNTPETFDVMMKNINSLSLYIRFDGY